MACAGQMLKDAHYEIKVLNLEDMSRSDKYNPFRYLRKDRQEDVLSLINLIVKNTEDSSKKSSDPFWEKAESLFLQALFFYILYEEPPERQNIGTVIEMLRLANFTVEKDGSYSQNPLYDKFDLLKEKDPDNIAVIQYNFLKSSAKETLRSIVITATARFGVFAVKGIKDIFSHDTFELDLIDERKTAIFVIVSPVNTTFSFISSMLYSQVFRQMDYIANHLYPGKGLPPVLNRSTLFILDEFANGGKIPDFEKILAYARSLNAGICPIIQSLVQLKEMYRDSWETIYECCDTKVFLGGSTQFTLEYFSKQIGKETLDNISRSRSKGKNSSTSKNEGVLGRELMTPDEIALMPFEEQLLFIKGFRVYKGKKFRKKDHKNAKLLAENPKDFYVHKSEPKSQTVMKLGESGASDVLKIFDESDDSEIFDDFMIEDNLKELKEEELTEHKERESEQELKPTEHEEHKSERELQIREQRQILELVSQYIFAEQQELSRESPVEHELIVSGDYNKDNFEEVKNESEESAKNNEDKENNETEESEETGERNKSEEINKPEKPEKIEAKGEKNYEDTNKTDVKDDVETINEQDSPNKPGVTHMEGQDYDKQYRQQTLQKFQESLEQEDFADETLGAEHEMLFFDDDSLIFDTPDMPFGDEYTEYEHEENNPDIQ